MISDTILYAMANRLRGTKLGGATESTTISRIVCCLAMASVAQSILGALVLFIGFWLAFLPGWGRYLGAIVNNVIANEKEVWVIDYIMDRFILSPTIWGTIAMCLRFLMFAPALAIYTWVVNGSYLPLLGVPLMGIVCYIFRKRAGKGWALCEYAYGAVLGIIVKAI